MLYDVMNSVNNHFLKTSEIGTFEIVVDGVIGSFSNSYLVGQYILIKNSILNDGVYKITQVLSNKLVLDATLQAETNRVCILGLAVPTTFINLVNDIENWQSKHGCNMGVSSESIDDYSIGYDTSKGTGWQIVYRSQLNVYRKMFPDVKCNKCRWY